MKYMLFVKWDNDPTKEYHIETFSSIEEATHEGDLLKESYNQEEEFKGANFHVKTVQVMDIMFLK